MEAVALLRHCPTSTRKMRLVADMIRGMEAEKALYVLRFSQKEASKPVEKLLLSAISNWKAKNEGERVEDSQLFVKGIFVDQGRTLRRFQPAPMGRAYRIRKRANHVTLVVDSKLAAATPIAEPELAENEAPVAEVQETTTKKTKTSKKK